MSGVVRSGVGTGSKVGAEGVIDALRGAQRTNLSPIDHSDQNGQLLGHYRASFVTGTTVSISAGGILAYLRWSDTSRYAMINRIQVAAAVSSAITAATVVDIGAFVSRGATAAGSGGGALTLTGNNAKLRSNMGSSLVSDARVATTAALTRPTSATADSQAIAATCFGIKVSPDIGATASATCAVGVASPVVDLYKIDSAGQHPLILTSGEVLELQEITAGPTTGGIKWYITVEWAELAYF